MILSREEAIKRLHDVLVVPATSTVRGIDTEVEVEESDGMLTACALSLDNTFLVEKAMLRERIGALSTAKMDQVCRALNLATSCA